MYHIFLSKLFNVKRKMNFEKNVTYMSFIQILSPLQTTKYVYEKVKFVLGRIENIMVRGENAG